MQTMTIKIEVDAHGYVYYAEDAGRPEYAGRLRYPDVDCGEMGNVLAMPRNGTAAYFPHERQALAWMLAQHVGCDVALRDAPPTGDEVRDAWREHLAAHSA